MMHDDVLLEMTERLEHRRATFEGKGLSVGRSKIEEIV